MANSIAKFKKYVDLLDEVYQAEAKTSVLESDSTLVQAGANANEIIIQKISMDGLADYDRNGGYVGGDVTLTNETVKFNFDRGRTFSVDNMDNEETAGMAFGKLSSEFVRTKSVPELDAFRFATYSAKAGNTNPLATLSNGNDVLAALEDGSSEMDELEVPTTNRILFITPTLMKKVRATDTTKSREILDTFAQIVEVPQKRFYTVIDQLDGKTSGEEVGGFVKDASGKDINFMIIEKSAILQYTKHRVNKAISPEDNQEADAWKFFFRAYGLAEVQENKVAGIYLHSKNS